MIAAGAIASSVLIRADNFDDDGSVAVTYVDQNPRDWFVSFEELSQNFFVVSQLAPDIRLFDRWVLSFAFRAHLIPCDSGTCGDAVPADGCHDRVRDGDEADVDCGGSCRACTADRRCSGPWDCESNACDAGRCRAPTCSDGMRDGAETDVDCGGPCPGCAVDQRCRSNSDCATGECGVPCLSDDALGCLELGFEPADRCYPAPTSSGRSSAGL